MRDNLFLEACEYPNGQTYFKFFLKDCLIGRAEPLDGGYLVQNKRKPRPTAAEAAKQMIDDGLNKCENESRHWRKMMRLLKEDERNNAQ